MKVNLKEGQALVLPKKDKSFDPAQIPGAVKSAGFTPGAIELTAGGTLALKDGRLGLEMEGALRTLNLAGGGKERELRSRDDLLGQRVAVTGNFQLNQEGRAPTLTVAEWKIPPPNPD